MSRRFASAALALVGSQAIYNGGLFVQFIFIVRWFDDIGQGSYSYALGLASLFEVGVHWGSQHLVNREAADRFDDLKTRLPGLFSASLLTILIIAAVIAGIEGWTLAVIAGGALLRAGAMLLGAICIGRNRIAAPMTARVLSPVLGLMVMFVIVRPDPTLPGLALATVAATIGYAGPLLLAARRLGLPAPAMPSQWWPAWCRLAGEIWPYLLLFFVGQLLFRTDGALLKWLGDEALVAHYMRAFKWIEGLFFLPHVVASAAIPALIAAGRTSGTRAQGQTLTRIALILGGSLTLVAMSLNVIGPSVLHMMLGDAVAQSSSLFVSLVWSLPIHGLGIYLAAALVTLKRERQLLTVVLIASAGGIAAKVVGFHLGGTQAFVGGLYLGLLIHALGCAWCLRFRSQ